MTTNQPIVDLRCKDEWHLRLGQHTLWPDANEPFCRECDPYSHFQKHDYRCSLRPVEVKS